LGCPEAEAMLIEVCLDAINEGVAFFSREQGGHELHYGGVAIDSGKRHAILRLPGTEN